MTTVAGGAQPEKENNAMSGIDRISAERQRQINVKGYKADHDRGHERDLINAAFCYLVAAYPGEPELHTRNEPPAAWPWRPEEWKPSSDPVRNLEKAGALIASTIDAMEGSKS